MYIKHLTPEHHLRWILTQSYYFIFFGKAFSHRIRWRDYWKKGMRKNVEFLFVFFVDYVSFLQIGIIHFCLFIFVNLLHSSFVSFSPCLSLTFSPLHLCRYLVFRSSFFNYTYSRITDHPYSFIISFCLFIYHILFIITFYQYL